jgi:hypothetical protein
MDALLAVEITAKWRKEPGETYRELTKELGDPLYDEQRQPPPFCRE